jgi:AcrR family transcriptional regulator
MLNPQLADITSASARDRILHSAHDLFYREGIRATGIDRVIAESNVSKATFYRHFPSKNDLVLAFLEYRHQQWMEWFTDSLSRNGKGLNALVPTLAEWFKDERFRGCAFINSVSELGGSLPDVIEISRRHKSEMVLAIAGLLPKSRHRGQDSQAIALAVDGAIVQAQIHPSPDAALRTLARMLKLFSAKAAGPTASEVTLAR